MNGAGPSSAELVLSPVDARSCVDRIRDHYQSFWFELRDFHKGRGWLALGYTSFKACVVQELGMSEQRAYQLLAAAEVHDTLDTQHVLSTDLTEGHARQLATLAPAEQGATWAEAVRTDPNGRPSVADLRKLVRQRSDENKAERAARPGPPKPEAPATPAGIVLERGDAAELPLDSNLVDLIVTSPPYALDMAYTQGDVAADSWLDFMAAWLAEAYRVTKDRGRLALNVPLDASAPLARPTYAQSVTLAQRAGWTYKTTIVWDEGNTSKGNRALGSINSAARPHPICPAEMVPIFYKGDWGPSSDNPDDIWPEEWQEWSRTVWRFSGESLGWEGHPAPFPVELPRRLIRLFCRVGDTVLDPFLGSGSTALAAYRLGRKCIGYDISGEYVAAARRRLAKFSGGNNAKDRE